MPEARRRQEFVSCQNDFLHCNSGQLHLQMEAFCVQQVWERGNHLQSKEVGRGGRAGRIPLGMSSPPTPPRRLQEPTALPCAALRGLPQKGTSKADPDPSPDAHAILAASALAGRCLGSSGVCMLA